MHWAFLRRNRGRVAIQFDCPHKRCNLSIEQFPIFAAVIQVCGNTTSKFDKQYKLGQVFHIALWRCNRIAGLKRRIAHFRVDIIYVSLHLLHSSTSPLLYIKLGYYSTTPPPTGQFWRSYGNSSLSNIAYMSGLRSLFQADGAANCDELVRRRNEDRILQTIGRCHQPSKATPIIIACLFFETLKVIHGFITI